MEKVFHYLKSACRPYSVNDIHNNMQNSTGLGKAAVQRAIDSLVEEGTVKEKAYGKQKIYYVDQSKVDPVSPEEMAAIDEKIAALTPEAKQLAEEVKRLEAQASGLGKEKSVAELRAEAHALEKECTELEARLQTLKEGSGGVDPVENRKIKEQWTRNVKLWRERKRLASGILDMILEGYPKPKKALLEEIGIETDEDYDVTIPKL